jgi:ribosomal protein L11 methyltransferase
MKSGAIWKISVTTTAEAEDAVAELLFRLSGAAASAYTDAETEATTVAVFCERRPPQLAAKRIALRAGLREIKGCGLNIGPGRIRVQEIPREDWAESWKRHFKPIKIGHRLLIKPSWSKRRACAGQAVVVLDPGLSFGTGQHPTTEFCLRELVRFQTTSERARSPSAPREWRSSTPRFRRSTEIRPAATGDRSRSFLDVGTGSGILAIAAAKLGYGPVLALDFDPEAVRIACANARANGVSSRIRIVRVDVTKPPRDFQRRFDVVCANLISTLLIAERRTIAAMVKRSGLLVLAGMLKSEFREVQVAYESLGLELVASRTENEWRSGSFCYAHHFNSHSQT